MQVYPDCCYKNIQHVFVPDPRRKLLAGCQIAICTPELGGEFVIALSGHILWAKTFMDMLTSTQRCHPPTKSAIYCHRL